MYYAFAPDGQFDYMAVAKNQKEFAAKLGVSVSTLKRHGMSKLTWLSDREGRLIVVAESEPGRLWKKKCDGDGQTHAWVFADALPAEV